MVITTKADIGDTIYFLYENRVYTDIIVDIHTATKQSSTFVHPHTREVEVLYFISNKENRFKSDILDENKIGTSFESLM